MISSASFSVAAGGSSAARLRLDSAARQLLRGSRHQRVQLSVAPAYTFVATPVGVALVWPTPRATKELVVTGWRGAAPVRVGGDVS